MPNSKFHIVSLVLAILVCSCTKPATENVSGDAQVQIPLQSENGQFSLQTVLLKNLESLKSVRGAYADFYLSPKVSDQGLEGSPFEGRFSRVSDYWVPRDVMTLTAATLYYHLQQLNQFDISVGAGALKPARQAVALYALLSGNVRQTSNNALFEPKSNALLFVPYTDSYIPISVNSGILAHEHFHSLFFPLVLKPLADSGFLSKDLIASMHIGDHIRSGFDPSLQNKLEKIDSKPVTEDERKVRIRVFYHLVWLKAINEGLADVWGWAYSGDPDFIALSLPSEKEVRTLSYITTQGTSISGITSLRSQAIEIDRLGKDKRSQNIEANGYIVGTELARLMKRYSEISQISRLELLKGLMQPLAKMRDELMSLKKSDLYDPAHFFMQFSNGQNQQSALACDFLMKYLNSTLENLQSTYECQKDEQSYQPVLVGPK